MEFRRERQIKFLCICLFILPVCGYGEAVHDITALLKNAVEYSLHTPFYGYQVDEVNGEKHNEIRYYSNGRQMRVEYLGNHQRRPHCVIFSMPPENGEWLWIQSGRKGALADTVLARQYNSEWNWLRIAAGMIEPKRLASGNYKISNALYGNIPCYKLTVRYPVDYSTIANTTPWHFNHQVLKNLFAGRSPEIRTEPLIEEYREYHTQLRQAYFAVIELLIDRNPQRPFIYSCSMYDANGAQIDQRSWGEVNFEHKIDPDLFEIPSAAKQLKVATAEESDEKYINVYGAGSLKYSIMGGVGQFLTSVGEKIGYFLSELWEWLLPNGGWIFGILCGGIVVTLVVVKIKNR